MAGLRVLVVFSGIVLSACASAPPVAPARPNMIFRDEPVLVADLAARHDLAMLYDARRNRLVLEGGGRRVLLFPGTTVAVVDGVRLAGVEKIEGERDRWRIARDDAGRIEAALSAAPPTSAPAPAAPPVRVSAEPAIASPDETLPPYDPAWRVKLTRAWRYIVIHHSATPTGSAAAFHRHHRNENGWDGLGYDFVIGNGRGSGDGVVEVGYRWKQQLTGAHAGKGRNDSNVMNETGIGICLVGDFDKAPPTAAQVRALERLVAFLQSYCGIPAERILGHADVRDTSCPGKLFPAARFFAPRRVVPAAFR